MLNLTQRRRQAGLSLVELLVGIAVGLFITGGAIAMFVFNLKTSRQMLLEARVNQDLRAAADLIARDLRRAGYWENAIAGTITTAGGNSTTPNPVRVVQVSGNEINYRVSRDSPNGRAASSGDLDSLNLSDELLSFRLNGNTLQMRFDDGTNWLPMTDPNIVSINNFAITESKRQFDLSGFCARACDTSIAGNTCPKGFVRSYQILIKGTATHDSSVERVLRETVRVRADEVSGACPP